MLHPEPEAEATETAPESAKTSINGWSPPTCNGIRRLEFSETQGQRLTHQLFRFPAKFHAPVVSHLLASYTEPGASIVDPFCGSGTLLVEASVSGRHAIGFDVDPLSVFLSETKSRAVDVDKLRVAPSFTVYLDRP